MEETLGDYKRSLRKIKSKKIEQKLKALSETPLDLKEVTDVVECEAMWKECEEAIEQPKRGEDVPGQVLNHCMIAMATQLMYKSWQRPGAVCNCTMG